MMKLLRPGSYRTYEQQNLRQAFWNMVLEREMSTSRAEMTEVHLLPPRGPRSKEFFYSICSKNPLDKTCKQFGNNM